jgi:tetratricopeptide (TPR) repeat protein
MLKRSLLLFVCLIFGLYGYAQESQKPQLVFDEANEQLQDGDIQGALEQYHRLKTNNQLSGALFLNMGLSYIRADSMGKAKYYFLKAGEFEETQSRAQNGLDYVENRFSHQSAVLPTLPWEKALNWMNDQIGAAILLAIGLLLFNLGIFLYIISWFSIRSLSLLSTAGVTVVTAGVLVVLLSFYTDYREERYRQAVMITEETAVRDQPAPDAGTVSRAFEGYTFTVDRQKSSAETGWSYVRLSNGQYGWIPASEIMTL